jgi:hypothetical protein
MAQINNFGNTPGTFHQSLIFCTHFGVSGFQREVPLCESGEQPFMISSRPGKLLKRLIHLRRPKEINKAGPNDCYRFEFQIVCERCLGSALGKRRLRNEFAS